MKKLIITGLLTFILMAGAEAQFRMGLRGGINTAYFNATELVTDDYSFTTLNDASVGFHGGIMMQLNFFGMFIQPEILFSSIGSEVRVTELGQNTAGIIKEQTYNKLDIPVLVGRRFGPARVGIGPVGTIMLSTASELNEFGLEENFNSATFGYQAGVGVDLFDRLALDLKYEGNLSKLGSGVTVGGQEREFDSRARQFIVSVGIFF
ncbi:MAG: PorT family protein [Marinilabiliales bacterium]|nr:MAG: PorT family protein [Marinilabiliales bacterium]